MQKKNEATSVIDSETLLRNEASEFLHEKLKMYLTERRGHRVFYQDMMDELERFFLTEHKMIFLDELLKGTEKELEEHNQICNLSGSLEKCKEHLYYNIVKFFIGQEISKLPQIVSINHAAKGVNRQKAFLSYSRADQQFVDEFKRHIPSISSSIDIWHDQEIKVGKRWKVEIEKAIEESLIAILFISTDFFNSTFISKVELPKLLRKAEAEGATIINVFIGTCNTDKYQSIMDYQGVNTPDNTIKSIRTLEKRDEMWVKLVKAIEQAFSLR